jgi:hypothetical protein
MLDQENRRFFLRALPPRAVRNSVGASAGNEVLAHLPTERGNHRLDHNFLYICAVPNICGGERNFGIGHPSVSIENDGHASCADVTECGGRGQNRAGLDHLRKNQMLQVRIVWRFLLFCYS